MSWYVVRINKETRKQNPEVSPPLSGCLSGLHSASNFIRDTNLSTHELYAKYNKHNYPCHMEDFLESDENPTPIKKGVHFFTDAENFYIRLDSVPYRYCMLTKFLLCNVGNGNIDTSHFEKVTGRPLQMPPEMYKIARAMIPFNFVFEGDKVINANNLYTTRCYDSWIRCNSNTANMNVFYGLLTGSESFKRELDGGTIGPKSIINFIIAGSSWKSHEIAINNMFISKAPKAGVIVPGKCEHIYTINYLGKTSQDFTGYVTTQLRQKQLDNALLFARGIYRWAEKMYTKKSKRPGYWYDKYINSKIPNIATYTEEDFQ